MTKKNIIIVPFLILSIFICTNIVYSASESIPVLMKGKVIDKFSNKPCEVKITFIDENSKKFSVQANILDGHYEQVLMSGKQYEVLFFNWNVARESHIINIEDTEEYIEIIKNFEIKKLDVNNVLYDEDLFISSTAELSPAGIVLVKQLENILKFNRGVSLKFIVATNAKDAKNTKAELLNLRLNKLKRIDEFNKYSSRITFDKENKTENTNFKVIVNEIKDPLNN